MPPLILDGSGGISGVDGTASNPAIEGTDSNTGIFYPAADTVAIGTGGTEALRVNSSQNVGIGTTTPGSKLESAGTIAAKFANPDTSGIRIEATTGTNAAAMRFTNTGGNAYIGLDNSSGTRIGTAAYSLNVWHESAYPILFGTSNAERARITSDGILGLTQATASGAYIRCESTVSIASNGTVNITVNDSGACIILVYQTSTGDGGMFFANYTAAVTKIAGDGSATDAGATFAVYKSASSHTTTIRNRYGATRTFKIAVYSASAAP